MPDSRQSTVAWSCRLVICLLFAAAATTAAPTEEAEADGEKPERLIDEKHDLISLHYDHAPDKDDGQSAAADRTILHTLFGAEWVSEHTVAVSGAYGKNKNRFNEKSDKVMDVVWGEDQWLAADADWDAAVDALAERWMKTLRGDGGGDVWVKEGGQSDITADALRVVRRKMPHLVTTERIHVVQHSDWNENQTTDKALAYVKKHTDYIRIKDANRYLNRKGGDRAFERAALGHPEFGEDWRAAFDYYNPRHRLDFSDTGELMHMLGLGEMSIDRFRERFLEAE